MKKFISILLLLALLLTGCAAQEPAAETTVTETTAPETTETTVPETSGETVPETTEETVPEPQVTEVESLLEKLPAILAFFSRGDRVEVVGEYDEAYLVVKLEEGSGLVEKSLLRMEGIEAPKTWTGYARWGAKLCGDLYLLDTDPDALNTNAQLTVLQELEHSYLVEFEGKLGYVPKDMVSATRSSGGGGGNGGGEWSPPVL